jgi:hypothetical protein
LSAIYTHAGKGTAQTSSQSETRTGRFFLRPETSVRLPLELEIRILVLKITCLELAVFVTVAEVAEVAEFGKSAEFKAVFGRFPTEAHNWLDYKTRKLKSKNFVEHIQILGGFIPQRLQQMKV